MLEEICVIEESIKGQVKNVLWYDYRKGIIIVLNVYIVKIVMVSFKVGKILNVSSLLKIFLEKLFKGNKVIEYGNKFELVVL